MTNTYALTDYDIYDEEENDDFLGTMIVARHLRKRIRKRRRKKKARRRKLVRPRLGRPPIKGRPRKRPPIIIKGTPIIPRYKTQVRPQIKKVLIKKRPTPRVKAKTPISHLIRKANPTVVKKPLSINSKTEVKQLDTAQIEASKKAMVSDSKTSKVVKTVAIIGVAGITGFGIYKFIQNKKTSNGHISASK